MVFGMIMPVLAMALPTAHELGGDQVQQLEIRQVFIEIVDCCKYT
jgi:hypothetical protein